MDEDKIVQAYPKGPNQLAVCDDVDVGVMIERKTGDKHVLLGHVIRGANHKTFQEIHAEIRAIQDKPDLSREKAPAWIRSALLLPWPLSACFKALIQRVMRHDPTIFMKMIGTVCITSIGMFGKGHSGWGVAPITHELGLIVGGTTWRPAIVEGRIEPRRMLSLTIVFDHDVSDGAPAARFTCRLVELVEQPALTTFSNNSISSSSAGIS